MVVAGCGSGGGGTVDRTPFLGVWSNTGGQVTSSCDTSGQGSTLAPDDLKITITEGSGASALIITFADPPGCAADADVSSDTATISADKSCPISGGTLTVKMGGTFTTSDGKTLNGNFVNVTDGGQGNTCTQTNVVPFSH